MNEPTRLQLVPGIDFPRDATYSRATWRCPGPGCDYPRTFAGASCWTCGRCGQLLRVPDAARTGDTFDAFGVAP